MSQKLMADCTLSVTVSRIALVTMAVLSSQNSHAQTVIITSQKNLDDMAELTVSARRRHSPALSLRVPKDATALPAVDTGDYLRQIPGVGSGRMGGHGLEPSIRGQSRSQINILNDGAYLEGAGPNRMDTPATFADIDTADLVIVERGYQSVTHGPGGSGGTIIIEHHAPTFAEGQTIKGRFDGAWQSNGDVSSVAGSLSGQFSDMFYGRLNAHLKDAGNYKDGHGNLVRSAFEVYGGSMEVGYGGPDTKARLMVSHEVVQDTLFPGAGMDSPKGSATTFSGMVRHEFDQRGIVQALDVSFYHAHTNHKMDNFSLREQMMMFRRADLDADTTGGKIAADLVVQQADVTVGLDFKQTKHDGLRLGNNMDRTMVDLVQSVLIPDAKTQNIGLFGEATTPLAPRTRLKAGVRLDRIKASARKTGLVNELVMPMMMPTSPDMLYNAYYGITAEDQTDLLGGGLLRLEYDVTDRTAFSVGISRSTRSANTVERYMASLMGDMVMPSGAIMNMSWVGNPGLKAEKHSQIDMSFGIQDVGWHVLLSGYYNSVDDYIFRDRAHGQAGILRSNNALTYRNIDARLWGFDLEAGGQLGQYVDLSGSVSYTNGHNRDLDIPLYQISPLQYDVTVRYSRESWSVGSRFYGALKQGRVDDNPLLSSGRDAGETAAYGLVDLFAAVHFGPVLTARFGVANLFDKFYADHLNRESLNDATTVRVTEPGRSFYFRIQSTF